MLEFIFDDVDNINILIKNVKSTYKIIEQKTPKCSSGNSYMSIYHFQKIIHFLFLIKLFMRVKNLISYFKFEIFKIIKFQKI